MYRFRVQRNSDTALWCSKPESFLFLVCLLLCSLSLLFHCRAVLKSTKHNVSSWEVGYESELLIEMLSKDQDVLNFRDDCFY